MTTPLADLAPLATIPDPVLAELRQRLHDAGYVGRIFGECEHILPRGAEAMRLPLIRWTLERRPEPWAALALLFYYGSPLAPARVHQLLGDGPAAALTAAGVLRPDAAGDLCSTLRLLPFIDLWIAADPTDGGAATVMLPGETTMQLAWMMPEACTGSVLDLGCGPGTLALVAARRGAAGVVGSDINPRAIELARFNARLNALAAEFVAGDLYAPVAGRRFDLVVAQPPYVIQPDAADAVVFLHSGPRGEDLVLRALAGLPGVLASGGLGLLLVDAPLPPDGRLAAHYRRALGDAAPDLVVVVAPAAPLEVQAAVYAQLADPSLGGTYERLARRYLDHLADLDTPGFRHAAILVRQRDDGGETLTAAFPVGQFGGAPERSATDLLAALDLAAAPAVRLLAARLERSRRAQWSLTAPAPILAGEVSWQVRFAPGALGVDQTVAERQCVMLDCIDTANCVEAGLLAFAEACDAEPGALAAEFVGFIRQALQTGLLEARAAPA